MAALRAEVPRKPMKKNPCDEMNDELQPEYDLRELLRTGVRGKYAKRYQAGTNLVLPEPDVAKVQSESSRRSSSRNI